MLDAVWDITRRTFLETAPKLIPEIMMGEDIFKGFLELGPIIMDVLTCSSLFRGVCSICAGKKWRSSSLWGISFKEPMADIKLFPVILSLISTIFS